LDEPDAGDAETAAFLGETVKVEGEFDVVAAGGGDGFVEALAPEAGQVGAVRAFFAAAEVGKGDFVQVAALARGFVDEGAEVGVAALGDVVAQAAKDGVVEGDVVPADDQGGGVEEIGEGGETGAGGLTRRTRRRGGGRNGNGGNGAVERAEDGSGPQRGRHGDGDAHAGDGAPAADLVGTVKDLEVEDNGGGNH